jgi:hypothetical protein
MIKLVNLKIEEKKINKKKDEEKKSTDFSSFIYVKEAVILKR